MDILPTHTKSIPFWVYNFKENTIVSIQLEFELFEDKLYISSTCKNCKRKCKIYCISNNAEIYCNKYKNTPKSN